MNARYYRPPTVSGLPKPPDEWRYEHITEPRPLWMESDSGKRAYYRMKLRNLWLGDTWRYGDVLVWRGCKPLLRAVYYVVNGAYIADLEEAVDAVYNALHGEKSEAA